MMAIHDAALESAEKDDEYLKLREEHHQRERLLHILTGKDHLSEDEDLEEKRLKKEKLALKDRMEEILRRYRSDVTA
jgi:uncharacterized protein YdcH (DUF465 family)